MNILLILNLAQATTLEKNFDFVIGVDGGCQWCINQNIAMDLAIGDFDSLNTVLYQQLSNHTRQIQKYNKDKDLTDLELALEVIKSLPAKHLTVLGCWGGRIDHQTANLFCLAKQTDNIPVTIPGPQHAYLLKEKQKIVIEQTIGQTVSILAILSDCTGIYNQGMT